MLFPIQVVQAQFRLCIVQQQKMDGIIVRWGIWQTIHKGGNNLLNSKGSAHRDSLRTLKDDHFMKIVTGLIVDVAGLAVTESLGQEFLKIVTGVIECDAVPDLADAKWMVGSSLVHDPNHVLTQLRILKSLLMEMQDIVTPYISTGPGTHSHFLQESSK